MGTFLSLVPVDQEDLEIAGAVFIRGAPSIGGTFLSAVPVDQAALEIDRALFNEQCS